MYGYIIKKYDDIKKYNCIIPSRRTSSILSLFK